MSDNVHNDDFLDDVRKNPPASWKAKEPSRYIHDDVKAIMDDAATDAPAPGQPSTAGWTPEQLQALNAMLQFAWNRGYKGGFEDASD